MKAAELREMDVEALRAKAQEIDDQLFRMRIQKSMGQLEAPGQDAQRPPRAGAHPHDSQREGEVAMAGKAEVQGVVVSDKMQKSVVVADRAPRAARRLRQDRRSARRRSSRTTRTNEAKVGDTVVIAETRPLSRRKRWALVRIVERAVAGLEDRRPP